MLERAIFVILILSLSSASSHGDEPGGAPKLEIGGGYTSLGGGTALVKVGLDGFESQTTRVFKIDVEVAGTLPGGQVNANYVDVKVEPISWYLEDKSTVIDFLPIQYTRMDDLGLDKRLSFYLGSVSYTREVKDQGFISIAFAALGWYWMNFTDDGGIKQDVQGFQGLYGSVHAGKDIPIGKSARFRFEIGAEASLNALDKSDYSRTIAGSEGPLDLVHPAEYPYSLFGAISVKIKEFIKIYAEIRHHSEGMNNYEYKQEVPGSGFSRSITIASTGVTVTL